MVVVRQSDGLVRAHGPPNNHCPGSGQPPVPGTSCSDPSLANSALADQSLDLFDSTHVDLATPPPPLLVPPGEKILKRIPRGARDAAASEFQKSLSAVLDQPDERQGWKRLFGFAGGCLYHPSGRGGRRQNLTTAVVAHIKVFGDSIGVERLEPPLKANQHLKANPSKSVNPETATARRAAAKMDEGDVKGAIRQLCSTDTLASPSRTSYQAILAKHPPAPFDRRPPSSTIAEPLTVSADEVLGAIRSFPPGSAGGPDGLRPQHLKDMTDRQVGGTVIESLTCFINLILSGKVPAWVRPFLFGAGLFAFNKKGGGMRPIAVGLTLRRLAAKVACRSVSEQCALFLKPRQLGVGVKGGAEALAPGVSWTVCRAAMSS